MIFITGATGFIGNALIKQLANWNEKLRILLPPTEKTLLLPKNIPVEIAVSTLNDEKNLRAALRNIDTIVHLASDEQRGARADLMSVDIQGTASLLNVARERNINHIIYLSHIGAEPASAFPLLKAKGIAENAIIQSGIPYTILKTGLVYGDGDHFIHRLANYLRMFPFFSMLPDKGQSLIHPLSIDDLIAAMLLVIDGAPDKNQQFLIGGPEYFTFHDVCIKILQQLHQRKIFIPLPGNTIRTGLLFAEQMFRNIPFSGFDLDYLAVDRTAPLDTLPRLFGIIPSRLQHYIDTL